MAGSRLEGIPALARRREQVPAACYNLWRRARRRLPLPQRLPLPGLHHMVLELEPDAWICLERRAAEVPVIAWLEFDEAARAGIHEPVPCQVHYYHFAASKLRARVLELMVRELGAVLAGHR